MSRYGNVKAGAYNKLNVDSESSDTSEKLNDVERVLNKMGISIRKTNLEFKDFDEVLDEIADRWGTLDNVTKRAMANAFAGVRQNEAFLVLMENYDKYKDLLDVSETSKGTAERKYQSYFIKYMLCHTL
jgi:TP901 family phage tail tape measure protein